MSALSMGWHDVAVRRFKFSFQFSMRGIVSKLSAAAAGLSAMLLGAAPVLAQYDDYYYDDYSYDTVDSAAAGVGLLGGGIMIFVWCCLILVAITNVIIMLVSLIHCIQHAPDDQKTLWILLILFVPLCGWIYFFTKRKQWSSTPAVKATETK